MNACTGLQMNWIKNYASGHATMGGGTKIAQPVVISNIKIIYQHTVHTIHFMLFFTVKNLEMINWSTRVNKYTKLICLNAHKIASYLAQDTKRFISFAEFKPERDSLP